MAAEHSDRDTDGSRNETGNRQDLNLEWQEEEISALHRTWVSRMKAIPKSPKEPYTKNDGTRWTDEEIAWFEAEMAKPSGRRIRIGTNFELLGIEETPSWTQKLLSWFRQAIKPKRLGIRIDLNGKSLP